MTEPEDAVRRALQEVAAQTGAADGAPPLHDRVVPLSTWRPSRVQRVVLGAVAAVIAVVAGVLVAALASNEDEPDTVETADDTTTTTEVDDSSTSSSISTSSTTSTTATTATTTTSTVPTATTLVPVPDDQRVVLTSGPTWRVVRTEGDSGSCLAVEQDGVARVVLTCDLRAAGLGPGPVFRHVLRGGEATLFVAPAGDADRVEPVNSLEPLDRVLFPDPFIDGLDLFVTDYWTHQVLFRRGDAIRAAIYDNELVTDLFEPYATYRRANGSLSMGEYLEIGAYGTPDRPCVVAFRLTPFLEVAADECDEAPFVTFSPTADPMLIDPFGLAPLSDDTEWSCELPSGRSCGSDTAVPVPELGVMVLSWHGPIGIDDGGTRADHLTFTIGEVTFEAPIPPA